jgi:multicomponent K+:H+ antiporter subunit E
MSEQSERTGAVREQRERTAAVREQRERSAALSGRRWLAHPWLSLTIAVSWLLLQGSLAWANLLWALILGAGLPWLVHDFIGDGARVRAPAAAVRLVFVVLWDIVRANITVARIALHPGARPRPAWVDVPYSLTDERAIVLLATIITTTPGTVSCHIDQERRRILVHALDAPDPAGVAAEIAQRYEQPLKEIFG